MFKQAALRHTRDTLIGLTLAWSAATASAAPLFEQAPLGDGDSYQVMVTSGVHWADKFSVGGAFSLAGLRWWGGYAGQLDAGDDSFVLRIYSELSNAGTLAHEFAVGTATRSAAALADLGGNDMYLYEYSLSLPLTLSGGSYFLSIENQGSSDWLWLQAQAGDGAAWTRLDDPAESWVDYPTDLSFAVLGERQVTTVPEPSALALLGLAGVALVVARRRHAG